MLLVHKTEVGVTENWKNLCAYRNKEVEGKNYFKNSLLKTEFPQQQSTIHIFALHQIYETYMKPDWNIL